MVATSDRLRGEDTVRVVGESEMRADGDAPIATCMMDGDGRVVEINDAAVRLFARVSGDEGGALVGPPFLDGVSTTHAQTLRRALARCARQRAPMEMEIELSARGTTIALLVIATPTTRGGLDTCSAAFLEVSRFRRREERLRALDALALTLGAAEDLEEALGALARQLVPAFASIVTIDLVSGDGTVARLSSNEPRRTLVDLPQAQRAALEARAPLVDGDTIVAPIFVGHRTAAVTACAACEQGPEAIAFLQRVSLHVAHAMARDDRLRQTLRAAALREEIMADASQALRGPLGTLTLNIETLRRRRDARRDAPLDVIERHLFEGTRRSIDRMTRTVDDLSGVVTALDATHSVVQDTVNVRSLLEAALACARAAADEKGLRVSSFVSSDVSFVQCDRERVLQVLDDLLGNAIAFARDGGKIRVEVTRGGDEVRFDVTDDGEPIAREDLAHVFDPRPHRPARAHGVPGVRPITRHTRGRGFGLSTVKAIIEAHGGRVCAESTHSGETTLSFTLWRAM